MSQQQQSFWERVKPWECPACGWKRISANLTDCPRCHAHRPGSAAAEMEANGQATRIYEGEKALQAGIAEMARQGWRVVSQTAYQPPAGAGRVALLGWGAKLIQPPIKFTVIYSRDTHTPSV